MKAQDVERTVERALLIAGLSPYQGAKASSPTTVPAISLQNSRIILKVKASGKYMEKLIIRKQKAKLNASTEA